MGVDTLITVDYHTAIVRSADQLDFHCVPCKFSNMLSEINLRDQKVDTLSEPDHLEYFLVCRATSSHIPQLKISLTVHAVLVEKKNFKFEVKPGAKLTNQLIHHSHLLI